MNEYLDCAELVREYRGNVLESIHNGHICVTSEQGVLYKAGSASVVTYFRSASKPVQMLPVLVRNLDNAYGLDAREVAILSGSHHGEDAHIDAILSILKKAQIDDSVFIMKPTYPANPACARRLIASGEPPRKIYHNCIGKHIAMILLARELGGKGEDYWRTDSPVHGEIISVITKLSGASISDVVCGIDGCGVPVFALPMHYLASTYFRLASPETIQDQSLSGAVKRNWAAIHEHPSMIGCSRHYSEIMCKDNNIIAKDGALGVFCIGLKKEKLGIAIRLQDGNAQMIPNVVTAVLEKLGYSNLETIEAIREQYPSHVINDNGVIVGKIETPFELKNCRDICSEE